MDVKIIMGVCVQSALNENVWGSGNMSITIPIDTAVKLDVYHLKQHFEVLYEQAWRNYNVKVLEQEQKGGEDAD